MSPFRVCCRVRHHSFNDTAIEMILGRNAKKGEVKSIGMYIFIEDCESIFLSENGPT